MARIRSATNYGIESLDTGWQVAGVPSGGSAAPTSPNDLDGASLEWQSALCPGTVASARRARGAWDWDSRQNFDASDWWYRTRFQSTPCARDESLWLELDGLATIADVWLNGAHVLSSDNMFCAHELDVSSLITTHNELAIRFASLEAACSVRRPRPRFKTRLIERHQLRWFRTTLLGRIPGWTPPVTAVGPWRGIRLVRRHGFSVRQADVQSRIDRGRAIVSARLTADLSDTQIESAMLHVGSSSTPFELTRSSSLTLDAELELPDAERWWPHSHGAQPRYPTSISLHTDRGVHTLTFDPLAFRTLALDQTGGRFALLVNDVEIRCRGACWTPVDVVSLAGDPATVATVKQARAAGMNMLRVGGTMIYESDAFYEACEAAGILVWQDFMFANCDYPDDDSAFVASVIREAEQFLARVETRACLAVLCGNSEIEQQVAMLGLPRERWKAPLFEEVLRVIAAARRADVPYVASTPTGGALPFQPDTGLTHYYGVGAYLRPLDDARRANVQFTPECLGFSNIPEDATVQQVLGDGRSPFHHPRWKARVPRDSGPGWDFEDVRDHYTKLLFGVDPNALRYEDTERALALGRVTTGEVMARTIAEWRRGASNCRGALIWFLRDLWPGAGWGLIDAQGLPKAVYYYVRRAMQSQVVFFSDEGLNGLSIHVVNDSERALDAAIELELIRSGSVRVAVGKARLEVPARGALEIAGSALFEHFIDLTHAYRFGPRQYDVAVVRLLDAESKLVSESSYFPAGLSSECVEDLGLEAVAEPVDGEAWQLRLQCKRFAQAVALDVPEFTAEDSYFQLSPGCERTIRLRANVEGAKPRGFARPLNAKHGTRINVGPREANGS